MPNISLELREDEDGQFIATCPELNLTAKADTQEQAVLRLQSLIIFSLSNVDANDIDLLELSQKGSSNSFMLYIPETKEPN